MYKRADWEGLKNYIGKVKEDLLANPTSKSVEELLISFKSSVNESCQDCSLQKDWFTKVFLGSPRQINA